MAPGEIKSVVYDRRTFDSKHASLNSCVNTMASCISEVTKILQYIAQASHGLVPPDVSKIVKKAISLRKMRDDSEYSTNTDKGNCDQDFYISTFISRYLSLLST